MYLGISRTTASASARIDIYSIYAHLQFSIETSVFRLDSCQPKRVEYVSNNLPDGARLASDSQCDRHSAHPLLIVVHSGCPQALRLPHATVSHGQFSRRWRLRERGTTHEQPTIDARMLLPSGSPFSSFRYSAVCRLVSTITLGDPDRSLSPPFPLSDGGGCSSASCVVCVCSEIRWQRTRKGSVVCAVSIISLA